MIGSFRGKEPVVAKLVFIADNATVLGDVVVGEGSSVWFGAVLRGDLDQIRIGTNTNIQDNVTIHTDAGKPTIIGDNVIVGHGAVLHGCTVEDGALIGIGAVVLNGAVVGNGAVVAAGAVVKENDRLPSRTLSVGIPAQTVSELDETAAAKLQANADGYRQLAAEYKAMRGE